MDPNEQFADEVRRNVRQLGADAALKTLSLDWMKAVHASGNYTYNFSWLGRPVIQYPQDIVAVQELVWSVKPDLIIETGVAHGGSLTLSASLLAMLDLAEATTEGRTLDPAQTRRRVVGVDVEIRPHNRNALEAHPFAGWMELIEGSSTAPETIAQVQAIAEGRERVLVFLDSDHTHDHVLAELRAYAPLVRCGSYCVVFDTLIDELPDELFPDRRWGQGDNPRTAVQAYLEETDRFVVEPEWDAKLQVTVAPSGFLKCVKD